MALATVVRGVAGALEEIFPTGDLLKIKLDEGSVYACFRSSDGERVTANVIYSDPDSYPNSGALVTCEGDSAAAEKLEGMSERFQDRAPLTLVLSKLCDALGIVYIENDLRRHETRGRSSAGGGADAAPPSAANNTGGDPEAMSEGSNGGSDAGDGGASGDGEDDSDGAEPMEEQSSEDEDRDLLVECGVRQGKWERHEAEVAKATQAAGLSMEQVAASRRQIFTAVEGFKMLSNELLAIIKKQDPAMFADSVGDDLFKWDVWLSNFDRHSQIGKDMEAVSRRYAYSSVQLRFTFLRGLHPFFPPLLEVVRPHLAQPMLGALCSHPMLRLANWDPWRPMEQVVGAIKAFLESHGRVEVDHPLNAHPECAYSPLEVALGRLEALTDVKAAAHMKHAELYAARDEYGRNEASLEALQQVGKKLRLDPSSGSAQGVSSAAAAGGGSAASVGGAAVGAGAGGDSGGMQGVAAGGKASDATYWARGTGYGSGNMAGKNTWDPKQAEAAQKAQDEQLQAVLGALLDALNSHLGGERAAGGTAAPAAGAEAAGDAAGGGGDEGAAPPGLATVVPAIHDSVLLPFLWTHLCSAAFTEMTSRSTFYTTLLRITLALCDEATAPLLLAPAPAVEGEGGAVGAAVRGMQNAAKHYAVVIRKTVLPAGAEASGSGAGAPGGGSLTVSARTRAAAEEAVREATVGLAMADLVAEISSKLEAMEAKTRNRQQQGLQPQQQQASSSAAQAATEGAAAAAPAEAQAGHGRRRESPDAPRRRLTRAAAAAEKAAAAAAEQQHQQQGQQPDPQQQQEPQRQQQQQQQGQSEDYFAAMRPLQVDYHPAVCAQHLHLKHAQAEAAPLKTRAARVAKEIAGLERLLPLTESSGVFVRVDEGNTFLWRALITGPDDTPYSGGCFIFDIYFPGTYPQTPPMILLRTTGGGKFRFNPNLYNCGKVCLSLLGTWSGAQGESWNADVSTTFQVLISIQSLILVDEPYFNEPGYERTMHSESGKQQSQMYNKPIREKTIELAMLDLLRHPPPEWKDVITTHFRIRGPYILSTIDKWIDEAGKEGAHRARLAELKRQLQAELEKFPAPQQQGQGQQA